MFKISRLSDYATVVMAYLAIDPVVLYTARNITEHTHIALPTVTKILKMLTRKKLLLSRRGSNGGYTLAQTPETISIASIIEAIDGDLGITECSHANGQCYLEGSCTIRHNWRLISNVIYGALRNITLEQMSHPLQKDNLDLICGRNSSAVTEQQE